MITKISYQKITARTLLKVLFVFILLLIFNSLFGTKQDLNDATPTISYWLQHGLKWNNIVSLLIFASFFYYQDWSSQKELIENERKIMEKHNSWTEDEQS